jgi:hypothetical protein
MQSHSSDTIAAENCKFAPMSPVQRFGINAEKDRARADTGHSAFSRFWPGLC